MCLPFIIAAGVVATGASTALGAQAASDSAQANEWQAYLNKLTAEAQGEDAEWIGRNEAMAHLRQVAAAVGAQESTISASGVDISKGTAAQLVSQTRQVGLVDSAAIQLNAARKRWGYEVQAQDFAFEGRLAAMRGAAGVTSSIIGGASGLLGYATQGAVAYENANRPPPVINVTVTNTK